MPLHPLELLLLLGAALLIFAPKKLPQISSGIAKSIKDFRKELKAGQKEELPAPQKEEQA